MRYMNRPIPFPYAAILACACALALLLCLPVESDANPCDQQKIHQQSTEPSSAEQVNHKPDNPVKANPASEQVKADSSAEMAEEAVPAAELSTPVEAEKDGAKPEQVAAIDMEVLTERLKETDAIGLFTKLAIRNDVTDLIDNVKHYRKKSILAAKIKEIRANFEGLILKIVALLEDDPELSRDLYVGRESIWKSLLEVKA